MKLMDGEESVHGLQSHVPPREMLAPMPPAGVKNEKERVDMLVQAASLDLA